MYSTTYGFVGSLCYQRCRLHHLRSRQHARQQGPEVGENHHYQRWFDVSIFNSRFNLSVDWYNNVSSNLLIKQKIPTSTGYSDQYQNIGSIRNRGVEVVLNSTNIRTKDFCLDDGLQHRFQSLQGARHLRR